MDSEYIVKKVNKRIKQTYNIDEFIKFKYSTLSTAIIDKYDYTYLFYPQTNFDDEFLRLYSYEELLAEATSHIRKKLKNIKIFTSKDYPLYLIKDLQYNTNPSSLYIHIDLYGINFYANGYLDDWDFISDLFYRLSKFSNELNKLNNFNLYLENEGYQKCICCVYENLLFSRSFYIDKFELFINAFSSTFSKETRDKIHSLKCLHKLNES